VFPVTVLAGAGVLLTELLDRKSGRDPVRVTSIEAWPASNQEGASTGSLGQVVRTIDLRRRTQQLSKITRKDHSARRRGAYLGDPVQSVTFFQVLSGLYSVNASASSEVFSPRSFWWTTPF
jgi:hypothetical protein